MAANFGLTGEEMYDTSIFNALIQALAQRRQEAGRGGEAGLSLLSNIMSQKVGTQEDIKKAKAVAQLTQLYKDLENVKKSSTYGYNKFNPLTKQWEYVKEGTKESNWEARRKQSKLQEMQNQINSLGGSYG